MIVEAEADPSDDDDDDDDAIDFIAFDQATALLLLGKDVTLFACLPLFYFQSVVVYGTKCILYGTKCIVDGMGLPISTGPCFKIGIEVPSK